MQMNRSMILTDSINIKFTYQSKQETQFQQKPVIYQSFINNDNQQNRPPRQQLAFNPSKRLSRRKNKTVFQSFTQQTYSQMMKSSFCQTGSSDRSSCQNLNGIDKLVSLGVKEIPEEQYIPSIEDFQIGELLGKGATAHVYLCRHIQTGFFFALKKIKKTSVKDINQLILSIKIHTFFKQPNIVQLYSVFDDENHLYLLMEACLDGHLKCNQSNIKSTKQIKKTILGIAYGLRHLHKRGIRHGDIKLQNIINCWGLPKIADFDTIYLTKNQQSGNPKRSRSKLWGSPLYFSPQMIKESIFGINDDVWSLGILMYELVCGCYPFEIKETKDLFKIANQQIKQFPPNIDTGLKTLIKSMLQKRVCNRPELAAIIQQLQRD